MVAVMNVECVSEDNPEPVLTRVRVQNLAT